MAEQRSQDRAQGTDSSSGRKGPHRSERPVYGRKFRTRLPQAQQYIFVGLALMFLVAWFLFRDSCSRRIGETFGTVSGQKTRDAGVTPDADPRTMRPRSDPDDW